MFSPHLFQPTPLPLLLDQSTLKIHISHNFKYRNKDCKASFVVQPFNYKSIFINFPQTSKLWVIWIIKGMWTFCPQQSKLRVLLCMKAVCRTYLLTQPSLVISMLVTKIDHILNQHPTIPSLVETTITSRAFDLTYIVTGKNWPKSVNRSFPLREGGDIKTKKHFCTAFSQISHRSHQVRPTSRSRPQNLIKKKNNETFLWSFKRIEWKLIYVLF